MGIKLRPYHPTYVISFFPQGKMENGFNKDGFNYVLSRVIGNLDVEVELVEEYDDICRGCARLRKSDKGTVWGKYYTCPSAEDPQMVANVNRINKIVLGKLGLQFGTVIKFRELVKLLAENIPILDDPLIGGKNLQYSYEKGIASILGSDMLKKAAADLG